MWVPPEPTDLADPPTPFLLDGHPVPFINPGLTRRPRNMFIIDFGTDRSEAQAASTNSPSNTPATTSNPSGLRQIRRRDRCAMVASAAAWLNLPISTP